MRLIIQDVSLTLKWDNEGVSISFHYCTMARMWNVKILGNRMLPSSDLRDGLARVGII